MATDFEDRMHHHLYSNEGREEQCKRICKLESLVFDSLSFALACVWHLNEIAGYERMEPTAPTTISFAELLQRAKELEVPDA